jgi:hypothetical protein
MAQTENRQADVGRQIRLFWPAISAPAVVLLALLLQALPRPAAEIGIALLVAAAALAAGMLLGFLFGIPRSLQSAAGPGVAAGDHPVHGGHAVNTNLEQISDWLTKILIGIGLVELGRITRSAGALVREVGLALGPGADGRVAAGAIMISFAMSGFLLGYITTRTLLTRMFVRYDLAELHSVVDARITIHEHEDALALRLVIQQLDENEPPVDDSELRDALTAASSAIRGQILVQVDGVRKASWRDPTTQRRHDRTIPIFAALTHISPTSKRYWAALGFALKDKAPPDNRAAEHALTRAIELRGDPVTEHKEFYEFTRAIVRVRLLDENAADEAAVAAIRHDLRVAWRNPEVQRHIQRALDGSIEDDVDAENERLRPYLPAPIGLP